MILPSQEDFYAELSELIKLERIKHKVSQEQLAQVLNLSRASVINLEKGRHRPSVYQLLSMAAYFQIDYADLIPYRKKESQTNLEENSSVIENAITDQEEIDTSTKLVLDQFLSEIKSDKP